MSEWRTTPSAEPPAPGDTPPGDRPDLDGYELAPDPPIRGGMGLVYRATRLADGRPVAVKILPPGHEQNPESLRRFIVEREALQLLHHPNIVACVGHGEVPWTCRGERRVLPFYVMEFMEGGDLKRRLRGRRLKPRLAAELVRQLAQAVHYAHKHGVIHRDLNPANVLLTPAGDGAGLDLDDAPRSRADTGPPAADPAGPRRWVPKLADFSLARIGRRAEVTRHGEPLGTAPYMAPELAEGNTGAMGPRTDVYGLGTILYELLAGAPPITGHSERGSIVRAVKGELALPRHWRTAPSDLQTICLTCLRKNPNYDYTSAAALADDLGRFLDGQRIHAHPGPRPGLRTRLGWAAAGVLAGVGVSLLFGLSDVALKAFGPKVEDFTFSGMSELREGPVFQDFSAAAKGAVPRNAVSFQWADAFHQGWVKTTVCREPDGAAGHEHYLRVEFGQDPEARPANVAVRPLDSTPLRVQPRYRFLTFDLRAAPGAEQPGGLPVALRVVDAHLTHWRYVPLLTVGSSEWTAHVIDLRDLRRRQWEEFIGDGNATHRRDKPDFSVLVHVVLEFDCKVPGRPRCGSGAIDVANVKLAEGEGPTAK